MSGDYHIVTCDLVEFEKYLVDLLRSVKPETTKPSRMCRCAYLFS